MRKLYLAIIETLVMAAILVLATAYPVLADAGEARHEVKEVDGYKVKLTFVEGDVQVGHNDLNIKITDPQSQPVTDARVTLVTELYKKITSDTPSGGHGGMNMGSPSTTASPQETPSKTVNTALVAGEHAGEYEGEVDLSQSGHWMISAVFYVQEQEKRVEYLVDLKEVGPNWYVLSVFFGVIGAIITTGAITKRKTKTVMPEAVR